MYLSHVTSAKQSDQIDDTWVKSLSRKAIQNWNPDNEKSDSLGDGSAMPPFQHKLFDHGSFKALYPIVVVRAVISSLYVNTAILQLRNVLLSQLCIDRLSALHRARPSCPISS